MPLLKWINSNPSPGYHLKGLKMAQVNPCLFLYLKLGIVKDTEVLQCFIVCKSVRELLNFKSTQTIV